MRKTRRKICIITGTRAEWGLLAPLAHKIHNDQNLELQIIATGMHLSTEFGLTYRDITLPINKKCEILLSSDTPIGLCKAMGLAQISICEAYNELKPDIIVVLGDRYEIFACVASAMICRIPVAHLHGGEATEGLIDEAIRHSITKMSHLHFVATEPYKKRVIQLGENPSRVFNVGGFGIDNIISLDFLDKPSLESSLNFKLRDKNFLITFHPVTLENATAQEQFKALLDALKSLSTSYDIGYIFTKANADTDGRIINEMIDEFVRTHSNAIAFTSMGQLRYLSTMRFVNAVVGNSSSGLGEAPSFKVATINIGDRQKGRIKADSVIDCKPSYEEILQSCEYAMSGEFQAILQNVKNPYGEGGASQKTLEILKSYPLEGVLKKAFYDVDF
ncbi:UDP-N-acetylglucosamine 2-epimerase [Helicobacter cinaedi PAGU611]|uniref:UDP-N-acetylglucosamine 2-epimerase n=1 Tax=Helicobacter cinaedi TaxID=213 RepID=UPI00025D347B|nr:UDP-N-acetylglucosamine 2-epimerase [Helicobacter cinaedi]BAM12369.1 UDP-N-acetylglucosamine 2-epimerase [Helicobacter cinaedi PAGU611]